MSGPESLLQTMRELARDGLTWSQAVAFATCHVADLLGLRQKGRIAEGCDADLTVLTASGEVDRVYGRGRLLVEAGKPIVRGPFDGHHPACIEPPADGALKRDVGSPISSCGVKV